jgi:hypothetical protein
MHKRLGAACDRAVSAIECMLVYYDLAFAWFGLGPARWAGLY